MIKIQLYVLLFIGFLMLVIAPIFTTNTIHMSQTTYKNKSAVNLEISTENSGGGYIVNTNALYSWIEINATGTNMTIISEADDKYEAISFPPGSLGWNFTFYNKKYSKIYVSSNGWMSYTNKHTSTMLYLNDIPDVLDKNIDCVALLSEDIN